MELPDIKKALQAHLTDGLVIVVGSGLSVAEGLPGMEELAALLARALPPQLAGPDRLCWERIAARLADGDGLEAALLAEPPASPLQNILVRVVGDFVRAREREVIAKVVAGTESLRFSALLPHLLKPKAGIPVITTNYDRLIEVAAEDVGIGVDTMFVGHTLGRLDAAASRMGFCTGVRLQRERAILEYRPRITLHKPHGSLDWYMRGGEPVRLSDDVDATRLIVTPGLTKFRAGYDRPFDLHREHANAAVDQASRFLILGYGFNDDHLETHLVPRIEAGAPTVLVTRTATESALRLARKAPNMTVVDQDNGGTRVRRAGIERSFPDLHIWDLRNLIEEVF